MTETKDTTDKTLRGGGRKPLSLQRTVESGHVRQNFSHGRSKSVVVEKRKTRKLSGPGAGEQEVVSPAPAAEAPVARRPSRPEAAPPIEKLAPVVGRGLSDEERDARARALAAARQRDDVEREERARAEIAAAAAPPPPSPSPAAPPAVSEAPPPPPVTARAPEPRAPEARAPGPRAPEARAPEHRAPESRAPEHREARGPSTRTPDNRGSEGRGAPGRGPSQYAPRPRPGEAPRPRQGDAAPRPRTSYNPALQPREGGRPREIDIPLPSRNKPEPEAPKRVVRAPEIHDEEEGRGVKGSRKPGSVRTPTVKTDEKRERIKLTINNAFDEKQRERSLASLKRKREREKLKAMGISQSREKIVREVVIPEVITIQELANRMTERAVDVIKYLMKEGAMHQINDVLDADTAELHRAGVRAYAQARLRSRRRDRFHRRQGR